MSAQISAKRKQLNHVYKTVAQALQYAGINSYNVKSQITLDFIEYGKPPIIKVVEKGRFAEIERVGDSFYKLNKMGKLK